jgi:hypothetical protein
MLRDFNALLFVRSLIEVVELVWPVRRQLLKTM